jgi:hypothetical protein
MLELERFAIVLLDIWLLDIFVNNNLQAAAGAHRLAVNTSAHFD